MKTEKSISIQCLIKQVFKDIIKKYRGESVNTLINKKFDKIDKNDDVSIKTLITYSSGSFPAPVFPLAIRRVCSVPCP